MKVHVSIDEVPYNRKPDKSGIGKMKYRVARNWKQLELAELADMNGNRGHTIVPAHLEGGISAKDCVAMQIFALDFDHGCSFADIKCRCDEMGIKMAYAYHTFSSSEAEEKFRVVFVLEELLEDRFVINMLLHIFQCIFPDCDRSCKNMDRMFFGGKEVIYFDGEARLALVQLLRPLLESFDTGKHYSENMKRFARKMDILLVDGHLAMGRLEDRDAILGGNMDSAIIHKIGESMKSPFFVAEGYLHQSPTCKGKEMKKIDIGTGRTSCQLYDDFKEGKDIGHEAKFAIITNFLHINGGKKDFLDTIGAFYGDEDRDRWGSQIKYMKGYYPKRCSCDFCPYYGRCENIGTIVGTLAMDKKIYQEEKEYVSIHEAECCLEENLESAFQSDQEGIHLITAQTGLGKTSAYIKLIIDNPDRKFLIALPTNKLKEEVYQKRLACIPEEEKFMTVSIHGNSFFPSEIQIQISKAHACGIHDMTAKIVAEYYEEVKGNPDKRAVAEECERIMKGMAAIQEERVIVTTHAYFLQMPEAFLKRYTVIIDEDILQLQAFSRMNSISLECLDELAGMGFSVYSSLASELVDSEEGKYGRLRAVGISEPLSENQLEALECFGTDDNINDLVHAGSYVRMKDRETGRDSIKYFCPLKLPPMKYIILSATLNHDVYREYFRGKMEVYRYREKKAAYKGKLRQYTYHSLGRRDLSEKLQVFSYVRDMVRKQNLEIITFKMFEDRGDVGRLNSAGIHFGNSTGLNSLGGKDLAVVGTPYSVDENYKLIACYLGADVNQREDRRPRFRRVEYNGSSFLITTYKNPLLQKIQLFSLESELEQCVGRARLLRNDCNVYVFSAFPCEQAELHTRDYLDC